MSNTAETIDRFTGEYRFLSNFWYAEVWHDGISYPTVEHAFQAAKTLNFGKRKDISLLDSPGKAKSAGRKLPFPRGDWETVKFEIMYELVLQKFARHAELRQQLLETGDAVLVEGNNWGDRIWGRVDGVGENHLGRILMEVRSQFKNCRREAVLATKRKRRRERG
jgi:ribA/ribD-fused uncharacterized protein